MPKLGCATPAVYVYGEIDYKDVFGEARWTKFRLACVGNNLFQKGSFQLAFGGNEAN